METQELFLYSRVVWQNEEKRTNEEREKTYYFSSQEPCNIYRKGALNKLSAS